MTNVNKKMVFFNEGFPKVLQEEEQDRGTDKKGESLRLLIVNTYTLHIETLPLQNICVQNLNEIMKQS